MIKGKVKKIKFESIQDESYLSRFLIGGNTSVVNGKLRNVGDNNRLFFTIYNEFDLVNGNRYEINLTKPLYSLPNGIKDKYDVLNRIEYRYCDSIVIDGSSTDFNFVTENNSSTVTFKTTISNMKLDTNNSIVCDKLSTNENDEEHIVIKDDGLYLTVLKYKIGSTQISDLNKYLSNNPITVVYALKDVVLPIEYVGQTIQDSVMPSPTINSNLLDVKTEENGGITIKTSKLEEPTQNDVTVFSDIILRSLPNNKRDILEYENLELQSELIDKTLEKKKIIFTKNIEVANGAEFANRNDYTETKHGNFLEFKIPYVQCASNSIYCNIFNNLSNDEYNTKEKEGVYFNEEYFNLSFIVSLARIKNQTIDGFKEWIGNSNIILYYEKIRIEQNDVPFNEIKLYSLNTHFNIPLYYNESKPNVMVEYFLDKISTMEGYDISDYITSYQDTFSFSSSDNFRLGNTPSKSCSFTLMNAIDKQGNDIGKYISQYAINISYDIETDEPNQPYNVPSGLYYVYEKPERYTNKVNVVCNDQMAEFDIPYITKLSFPTTVRQQLNEICKNHDVLYDVTTIDVEVLNREVNFYDSTITERQYLGWIAEANSSNVFIEYGTLYFRSFHNKVDEVVPINYVTDYFVEEEFLLNKVSWTNGIAKYEYGTDDGNVLYLNSDNPYIQKQEYVNFIYEKVKGLVISSIKNITLLKGNPLIDLGETISFVDKDSKKEQFKVVVLENNFTFNGLFKNDMSSSIATKNEEDIVQTIGTDAKMRIIKTTVDQNNAKLTIVAKELDEAKGQLDEALIELQPDKIVQKVNTGIENGEAIETVSATLDKEGFTVRNGKISIRNKQNEEVLYGDVDGNLNVKGTITGSVINGSEINGTNITGSSFVAKRKRFLDVKPGDTDLIRKYIRGEITLTPEQLERLDFNFDGYISSKDYNIANKVLMGTMGKEQEDFVNINANKKLYEITIGTKDLSQKVKTKQVKLNSEGEAMADLMICDNLRCNDIIGRIRENSNESGLHISYDNIDDNSMASSNISLILGNRNFTNLYEPSLTTDALVIKSFYESKVLFKRAMPEIYYSTPYIDFHVEEIGKYEDYTQRIIAHTRNGNLIAEPGISNASDRRMKKDIKNIDNDFTSSILELLNPVEFRYIKKGSILRYGLIAQEVEEALITLGIDKTELPIVALPENDDMYYSIDYIQLISVLIGGWQKHQKQLNKQEFGTFETNQDGYAEVNLSKTFVRENKENDYQVSLTPYWNESGKYQIGISGKQKDKFIVRGEPNVKFDWQVMSK